MIQYARAGTTQLKSRLKRQIELQKKNLSMLGTQLTVKETLSGVQQPLYYSSWIYSAIHAIVSIPEYQKLEKISSRLGVSVKQVAEALEFLINAGILVRDKNGQVLTGKKQIHLGSDSPLIPKHHSNWRLQAIKYSERIQEQDLQYSSVVSLSLRDKKRIKDILVQGIKLSKEIVKDSKEEDICCLSLDFLPYSSSYRIQTLFKLLK